MIEIKELLSTPKKIIITTHINPDGDAIGSVLAMNQYLQMKGHEVKVLTPNDYPDFLKWMKGNHEIIIFHDNREKGERLINSADLIFCMDYNEPSRLKDLGEKVLKSPAQKILIDHHPNPEEIFDYKYSDISVSSTAELLYRFITEMGDKNLINKDIAECLYSGIMTDTGCFSFNSSNPSTFLTCAELLSKGIHKDKIFNLIYNNFSHDRMKLMGYCLNDKLKVIPELHTAYIWLTSEEFKRFNFKAGDTEGFVNLPHSIKDIHFTALFLEKKDHVKISFRSRGNFSVNEFSKKYFNGGGHKNAAGGESKLSMKETIVKFETLLNEYAVELKNTKWFSDES